MAGDSLTCSSSVFSPWVHACGTDAVYDSSNGGPFGGLFGTPIICSLQAAILGMHDTRDKPVVVNGQIVVRLTMVRRADIRPSGNGWSGGRHFPWLVNPLT